jgi:hypothetical protein
MRTSTSTLRLLDELSASLYRVSSLALYVLYGRLESLRDRLSGLSDDDLCTVDRSSQCLQPPLRELLREVDATGLITPRGRRDLHTVLECMRCIVSVYDDPVLAPSLGVAYNPIDLSRLVRDCCAGFDELAQERRIIYEVETPTHMKVALDPEKIRSALLSILFCAFKHTPMEGTIRCILDEDLEQNEAVITVVDKERGITERFRSMPMAPSAAVTGRGASDLLLATLDLLVMATIALAVGWRPDAGVLDIMAAFGLLLLLRSAMIWVGVLLGLLVRDQEAAGNLFAVAFPFGIISSVFTPPHLMPDWLGTIAMWNPVSATAGAVRELLGTPVPHGGSWIESHAMLMAVVWPLIITAVFLPLAVRRYQKLAT